MTLLFGAHRDRQHLLPVYARQTANSRRRKTRASSSCCPPPRPMRHCNRSSCSVNRCSRSCQSVPEMDQSFQVESPIMSIAGITLKPWDQRTRTRTANPAAAADRAEQGRRTADRRVRATGAARRAGTADPVRAEIDACRCRDLYPLRTKFLEDAQATGLFLFIDSDLKVDAPQQVIEIDRDKAAQTGPDHGTGLRGNGLAARRRLHQLLQPGFSILQGDFPGAAALTG